MRSLWLVARAEYLRLVAKRSFLLATLGIPVLIGIVMVIAIVIAQGKDDDRPFGYVDRAGVLTSVNVQEFGPLSARAYSDEASARAALEGGEIQAFFVIPADYRRTARVTQYVWSRAPQASLTGQLNAMLRAGLVADLPQETQTSLSRGVSVSLRSAAEGTEMGANEVVRIVLPLLVGLFFVIVVMSSAGYLLQAVTTEKENRMVEVMFTSISPAQLIGGKAAGLMGVALTQVGLWLGALAVALVVLVRRFEFLAGTTVDWSLLLVVIAYFLPTYALVAGIMITLGSMVTELQQGQQIAGVLNLVFMLPFFFLVFVFTNPNSAVLVALTLFPTTAFMTVAMRWGVTTIPFWQLAVGWSLLIITAGLTLVLAARVFRSGMLRYGQPLSLRGLARSLQASGRM